MTNGKKKIKKKKNALLNWIFFIVLITAVGAISWYSYGQTKKETRWKLQDYQAAESVYRGDLEMSILAPATLQPFEVVSVRPEASGQVKELLADVGDIVIEGQPLTILDQEDLGNALDSAVAQVEQAQASLDQARKGWTPRERQSLEAVIESAQLRYDETLEDLERITTLHDAGFASDEDLDNAQNAADTASQALQQAKDALDVLLTKGTTPEMIRSYEAAVELAKIRVRESQKALGDAIVYSPMTGVILERSITEGSVVVSSLASYSMGDSLFTIGDLSSMKAITSVDENDISTVLPDLPCRLNVDAFPDESFDGTVLKIHPQADVQGGVTSFTVEVTVPNPDRRLMAGMSCEVEIITETLKDILLVPDRAIIVKDEKSYVFVVGDDDKLEIRTIEIGRTNYDNTEVLSGLEEGERVVVRGVPRDLIDEMLKKENKGKKNNLSEEESGGVKVEVR